MGHGSRLEFAWDPCFFGIFLGFREWWDECGWMLPSRKSGCWNVLWPGFCWLILVVEKNANDKYLSLTFSVAFSSFFQKKGGKLPVDQLFFSLLPKCAWGGNFVDQKNASKVGRRPTCER